MIQSDSLNMIDGLKINKIYEQTFIRDYLKIYRDAVNIYASPISQKSRHTS